MDKPKRTRGQYDSGCRMYKSMKEGVPKKQKKEIQIKEKNDFKPSVVVEAIIEELVETNQLLTNVNNVREPSIISTDKIELIELARDSVLLTGFRFIGLFILSDVISLLACLN